MINLKVTFYIGRYAKGLILGQQLGKCYEHLCSCRNINWVIDGMLFCKTTYFNSEHSLLSMLP